MSFPDGIVIVAAARTPVGRFQGGLSALSAPQLGALAVKEVVRRAGIDPATVDECIMGNVLSAGLGQNPARQAALFGGLPASVAALTINKVCGSGLKAVALAAQAVQTGNAEIVVAGGMESMSNAPYLLPQARQGFRLGNATAVDSMIHDGLWDAYNDYHMGITGENVAAKHGITREEQDAFALNSHRRATAAWEEGRFDAEVIPVSVPAKKRGAPSRTLSPATNPFARMPASKRWRRSSPHSKRMAPSPRVTPPASTTQPRRWS
jgi:acetyl-CoA C-acetyltransferase